MADSIADYLLRIKENIASVENGVHSKPVYDEIEYDYFRMMELIKLFLISERDSYYGYFLMNMLFSVNFCVNSIAGIKLNTFPPVFEANPLLFCKFSLKEIIYITCHEIDHIVLNHPAEMVKACPDNNKDMLYKFNLAADASVNDRINYEIRSQNRKFMSPPEGLITSSALKKMFRLRNVNELESYAYYFELIKEKQDSDDKNQQDNMMQSISGSESDPSQSEDPAENSDGTDSNDIITAKNCGKLEDHSWEAGNDAEDAAEAVKELVNRAVSMMSDESRGMMPGRFISQVEKINKPPEISWQTILKKYVGTISANKRKTRSRLNRRQPDRYDLSGSMDDKILKIVVAIDTSASVEDSDIALIFNEIFAILAKRKHEITVIECDSKIQRVYRAVNAGDIKKKAAGRGGTLFAPVIEYVNNDRYFRDALLIYFTDGYGEDKIPKPLTYRNIWVVLGNADHLSLKNPYGVKVKL